MSPRRKTLVALVMVPVAMLFALVTITAASAKPTDGAATHQAARRMPTIKISMFAFSGPRAVNPGRKIRVKNLDSATHSVTADGGAFTIDVPGGTTVTFSAPMTSGTYPFHCRFHISMKGSLKVK